MRNVVEKEGLVFALLDTVKKAVRFSFLLRLICSHAGTGRWPLSVRLSHEVCTLQRERRRGYRDKRAVDGGMWLRQRVSFFCSPRPDEKAAQFSLSCCVNLLACSSKTLVIDCSAGS